MPTPANKQTVKVAHKSKALSPSVHPPPPSTPQPLKHQAQKYGPNKGEQSGQEKARRPATDAPA